MPVDPRLAPYAALLLRLTLGAAFLAHGLVLKLFVFGLPATADFFQSLGLPATADFFQSLGLPAWSAYAVFLAETAGGLCLLLGMQARWVALALLPVLLGATWAHWGNGWLFTNPGGGWEYPLCLSLLAVIQVLLGDGAWALGPSRRIPRLTAVGREATP